MTANTPTHKTRTVRRSMPYSPENSSGSRYRGRGGRGRGNQHPEMSNDRRKSERVVSKNMGRRREGMRRPHREPSRRSVHKIPELAQNNIRIIPFGGVEEVGRNMSAIEIGDDIIIIDAGIQFSEEDTPGIDYILPNTAYLEERRHKIRAMMFTHGHLDHIGAVPYLIEKVGNPPIYSRLLTTIMIQKRQEEFPHLPQLDIRVVEKEETLTLGNGLKVRFFAVTHTIPDSMGIIIETPYGDIVHTGDLKLDHIDGVPTQKEEDEFAIFKQRNVLLLMADSTNVWKPGFSIPEPVVHQNIEVIIKNTTGRLIIGTFASQLERIIKIIEICEKYDKRVVVEGRSMKNNIEIVKQLGLLKTKKETLITAQEMDQHPSDRIVALATGAQGDEFAALMRMANKTNKYFKVNKRDTILLSSSVIPGNERAVQKLMDNLSRQGAKIIHYQVAGVHSSGHANKDEALWIHNKINPRFFIPIHGYHYMLRVHADTAMSRGMPEKNIVIPDNGMIIEIQNSGEKILALKEKAPSNVILVDGFSIGDAQEVVLRDRNVLAQEGMFVVIASINPKTGRLRKSPDIISRGFVYLRESQDLLQQTRLIVKKTIEDGAKNMRPINFDYIKSAVSDAAGRFLFQKTNKRPIIIPVLIGV
jgi:ribonuclease J